MTKLPMYDTKLFSEIFNNDFDFLVAYKNNGLYVSDVSGQSKIDDNHIKILFYLLYSQYANSPIANYDENQFKYKMWTIIFEYGPSWVKKMDIQSKLRNLTEAEITTGSNAIYNHAYNPESAPSTGSTTELPYINEQNVNKWQKSKLDAYSNLWDIIRADVTAEFVNRFKGLFKVVVRPQINRIFVTETEDDE